MRELINFNFKRRRRSSPIHMVEDDRDGDSRRHRVAALQSQLAAMTANEEERGDGGDSSAGGENNDTQQQQQQQTGRSAIDDDDDDDSLSLNPVFYNAFLFLMIATLLQVVSTSQHSVGPFDWFAGVVIPKFLSLGLPPGSDDDDYGVGYYADYACPPDQWIDEAFAPRKQAGDSLYSTEHDPRNKVSRPPLFPHCALNRWVQSGGEEIDCPADHEYVTIIHPPPIVHKLTKEGKADEGRIPKIIHLSSPTNCLPTSTVQTLRKLTHQHISQAYTIYVHSNVTMDNFLFQREWNVFPQVKEGLLCGMGKLTAVTHAAIKELKLGNVTDGKSDAIANLIAMGVKRDIWRYMILWEYGGVALDIDTLHAILSSEEGGGTALTAGATLPKDEGSWEKNMQVAYDAQEKLKSTLLNASTSAVKSAHSTKWGIDTMRKLMQQWSSEKKSDALIYFYNNVDRQRLPFNERIPFTEMLVMAPHHPLLFYGAKVAFMFAIFDSQKLITDTGRTTKIPSIKEGLKNLNNKWKDIKTGDVLEMKNDNDNSIRFVNADTILPPSLTSPRVASWRTIYGAFESVLPGGVNFENMIVMMRHFAAEQNYIPGGMFSCMEYTMDMYLQKKTDKDVQMKDERAMKAWEAEMSK